MWSKRFLGSVGISQALDPDSYTITLGFKIPSTSSRMPGFSRNTVLGEDGKQYARLTVRFTDEDSADSISARLADIQTDADMVEEHVRIRLRAERADSPGDIVCASSPAGSVSVTMAVQRVPPQLRSVDLKRLSTNGDGSCPSALPHVLAGLALEDVAQLKCAQGMLPVWHDDLFPRWQSLTVLNLSNCGLMSLVATVGRLTNLRELHADNNLLTAVPAHLQRCSKLEVLSLEGNRLTAPVMNLGAAPHLRCLRLMGNPLEMLPELGANPALRQMSLANVRVDADADFTSWTVEVMASGSYISRAHKLEPLCALIFRHSCTQHPLLAGALAQLMREDESNCAFIAGREGCIQQVVIMGLSDSDVVVEQACQIIGYLGRHSPAAAAEMMASNVGDTLERLVASRSHRSQVSGLRELAALALSSHAIAAGLLTPPLLAGILESAKSGTGDVQALALEALGNLAFCSAHALALQAAEPLRPLLVRLASSDGGGNAITQRARMAAIRALAILGENEEVRCAVGLPSLAGRGVRILAMDGGGLKGLATLRMLWQLQERTGRQIHEMFDLVCGTSTGGILAAALAIRCVPLSECENIYRVLGAKVFSRPAATQAEVESWLEKASRVYKQGTQSVRAAVYGCKHDSAVFEVLLKEYCKFSPSLNLIGDLCIDTACLPIPKCFVVSTLASVTPAAPFVLRNYEHSVAGAAIAARLGACPRGSSSFSVWQAVRASSAAPYYLDDFSHKGCRYQDGAATANNPAALALAEARALWPDTPVDVLVSLGSGKTTPRERERSLSTYLETGSVLIEAATDTEQVAAALATLAPLVPGLQYYRFNPEDVRCAMELDDINPVSWMAVEAAADDYIAANDEAFDAAAKALCHNAGAGTVFDSHRHRLGVRQEVLVVHALRSIGEGPAAAATASGAVARWLWASRYVTHAASPEPSPPVQEQQARGPRQRQPWRPRAQSRCTPGQPLVAAAAGAQATAAARGSSRIVTSAAALTKIATTQPVSSPTELRGSCAEVLASTTTPDVPLCGPAKKPRISNDADGSRQQSAARRLNTSWDALDRDSKDSTSNDTGAAAANVAALAAAARMSCDSVGAVHLALDTRGDGFVTKWQQELVAVADPGPQAEALLSEIVGAAAENGDSDEDPPDTLSAAFANHKGRVIDVADGDSVAVLGCQQQPMGDGTMASSFLLLRCRPQAVVSAPQVRSMLGAWQGQVVTTTASLSSAMVAALLSGGARAVIGRRPQAVEPSPDAARSFFSAFYNGLLTGRTVAEALKAAEGRILELSGHYSCSYR